MSSNVPALFGPRQDRQRPSGAESAAGRILRSNAPDSSVNRHSGISERSRLPGLPAAAVVVAALLLGLLAGGPAPVDAQEVTDDEARETLGVAVDRYAEVHAVCAHFEQVLTVELLGQERTSTGELCQRRPNLFSMRFSEPDRDVIVSDGSDFWIYYASVNPDQVIRLSQGGTRGGMDFYREFLAAPAEAYQVDGVGVEAVTGEETRRIRLTPRQPTGYRTADLWIEPNRGTIRRVEIAEDNGNIRRVTLTDIRVDPPIPEATFRFVVPDGVTVVRR